MKQIFLDTETTGLEPKDGHRIIEVVAIAYENRRLLAELHHFCNPQRDIDAGARAIHGISADFLSDKKVFGDIAEELQNFLHGGEVIIHNAEFDCAFLDSEFSRYGLPLMDEVAGRITCTLKMSKQKNNGLRRHRLEDLCRHFDIDDSARKNHSALLDAKLLAQVYYAMAREQMPMAMACAAPATPIAAEKIRRLAASDTERAAHEKYLETMAAESKVTPLWRQ